MIRNCVDKLKPLLMELVGDKTNEYSKFVVSLCQETSDAMEQSDIEASAKNAVCFFTFIDILNLCACLCVKLSTYIY